MNKKELSERDIITQFVIPSIKHAGWDTRTQIREEVFITDGRNFVKGHKPAHWMWHLCNLNSYEADKWMKNLGTTDQSKQE